MFNFSLGKDKLRDFQILRDHTMPNNLPSNKVSSTIKITESEFKCAEKCLENLGWCRSATYTKSIKKCRLYSSSMLMENFQPKVLFGTDLYTFSKYFIILVLLSKTEYTFRCITVCV